VPVSLAFHFPAGRYHATPYGHHVNEGLIEWPPSPWRILRALISVGYTSGIWNCSGPPPDARRLMEKLAAEPPQYWLPPALGTHSRHYMPLGGKDGKTILVFDTWARIKDQELIVTWCNLSLDSDELSMLRQLVGSLNYLGRSESWVEGRVMRDDETIPEVNCFPEGQDRVPDRDWQQVALLAPHCATAYNTWRADQLERALAHLPLPAGKKPTKQLLKQRNKVEHIYPTDLLDCLQKDTAWLRSHGWSRPPGSRRVFYWRRSNATISTSTLKATVRNPSPVQAMLLSLTNASLNDHALPPVIRTLPQAELLHRALISIAGKMDKLNGLPQELVGRDAMGKPLKGHREHAHINPLDLDGDQHLDHIVVWASIGLGADAQTIIRAARKTFTKGGIGPLRLALAATGDFQDLAKLSDGYGQRIARLRGPSLSWQSVTPFVSPRYLKMRGRNSLEGQIRAELSTRGFPDPTSVTLLAPLPQRSGDVVLENIGFDDKNAEVVWSNFRHFKLARQHGPRPPLVCGFAIRLEFSCPVVGPIAIGYGSHFGLGLFEQCGEIEVEI